jgi:hypothetical protein
LFFLSRCSISLFLRYFSRVVLFPSTLVLSHRCNFSLDLGFSTPAYFSHDVDSLSLVVRFPSTLFLSLLSYFFPRSWSFLPRRSFSLVIRSFSLFLRFLSNLEFSSRRMFSIDLVSFTLVIPFL